MKQTLRENTFETNSSSTHCLTLKDYEPMEYTSKDNKIIVRFINTDKEMILNSLEDKVSYLVSLIINRKKWDCENYHQLKELVEESFDFKEIKYKVKEMFNKDVVLPDTYENHWAWQR